MPYFPQLSSGARAQFPVVRSVRRRTTKCEQKDGLEWKVADTGVREREWVLEFRGLSKEEWRALEGLFHEVEGRRGTFVFVDPTDNLLVWSEELSQEAWYKDPYLELVEGAPDPKGGTCAARLRNSGEATQRIEQSLEIPSWYQYCFSVWLKGDPWSEVTLFARTGTAGEARTIRVSGSWQRACLPVKLGGAEELVKFGLELDPGRSVDVYGMQVDAQPGPSPYKRTRAQGGVYRGARFGDDFFEVVAEGPGSFGCRVRVVAAR